MQIMGIRIVVGQYGNLRKSRVIQCFSEQGTVMGQTAVPDIFRHPDGRVFRIVFSAFQRGKRFSDHHLGREADIVVHIFFPKPDGLLAAHLKRYCLNTLLNAWDVFGTSTVFRALSCFVNFTG